MSGLVLSKLYGGEWSFAASPLLNAEWVGDISLTNMFSRIPGVRESSTLSYGPMGEIYPNRSLDTVEGLLPERAFS